MPSEVKEYFEDGPKKIIKVIPRDDYSLIIYFENNEVRVYDMSDDLYGVFEILKDKNKVLIQIYTGTIELIYVKMLSI